MKILLLGGGGMLAADLIREAPAVHSLEVLSRADVDITNAIDLRNAVATRRADWIINAAAYTDVDGAERDVASAEAVNGYAVGAMGAIAAELACGVTHFSTDYVFDGLKPGPYDEGDTPSPLNVYGASKLLGEELLQRSGARHLILRTQWLYGRDGRSFPRTMYERATSGQPTRVVDDQVGRPTSTLDLARTTWRLLGVEGCYHVTNRGAASWFEVAQRVFAHAGVDAMLSPCSSAEYTTLAKRPLNSRLSCERLARDHAVDMPHWEDALQQFLMELAA